MAPFASLAQMRWMFLTHPRMAKKWAKEQKRSKGKSSFKKLPQRKRRSRDDLNLFSFFLTDKETDDDTET